MTGAASWLSEDISWVLGKHRDEGHQLSVLCQDGADRPCGIYVCDPSVLDCIPDRGYYDFKQQLIPRLLERRFKVGLIRVRGSAGEVVGLGSYLAVHRHSLLSAAVKGH